MASLLCWYVEEEKEEGEQHTLLAHVLGRGASRFGINAVGALLLGVESRSVRVPTIRRRAMRF